MPSTCEIRSLENTSFDDLFATHIEAFKNYPFQWGYDAFRHMLRRRSYVPALSYGAFHQGILVSFTLNGIGNFNGLHSAYDTGTGTVEEHRGKGLAGAIFEYSVPLLRQAGIKQYVLEVLEENASAYSVYCKQGFNISRTFDCFRTNTDEWIMPPRGTAEGIQLKEIDLSLRPQMEAMSDFRLSWQNSFQSLLNMPASFEAIGAFRGSTLVGYGIIEPTTGDIPLLAVTLQERRKGIGTLLLQELKNRNEAEILKIVNIESDQEGTKQFVINNGIPKIVAQYEMIKML